MLTIDQLVQTLTGIGCRQGDVLLVHSSLRRLGAVERGAEGVIDALLAVVGETGTVVVPTHTWAIVKPEQPVFHQRHSPSNVGALTNVFMRRPQAVRSLHPTHSVAAIGRRAAELVRGHELDHTPCAATSPYGKLRAWNGKVLLIGVGLERCTFFHGCEEWAGMEWAVRDQADDFVLIAADGSERPMSMHRHQIDSSTQFPRLEPGLIDAGAITIGSIGTCPLRLVDAALSADWVVAALQRDPKLVMPAAAATSPPGGAREIPAPLYGSAPTARGPSRRLNDRRLAHIGRIVDRYCADGRTAGAVTAVARHGKVVWFDARGYQDVAAAKLMRTDSMFRIFSMTKPITSVAVMLLVETGDVRLTDPLSRFFPEFARLRVYRDGTSPPFRTDPLQREITIRDLLTHTAGLAYGIGDEHPVEKAMEAELWPALARDPDLSLPGMLGVVAAVPLAAQPGTRWRYSIATDVLAAVVERVAGMPYAEFLQQRLFAPLGMVDTLFTLRPTDTPRFCTLYAAGPAIPSDPAAGPAAALRPLDDPLVMAYHRANAHPSGGGGLISTAADYLRFAGMLLNAGVAPESGERLLGTRTVEMMMMDHLPQSPDCLRYWPTAGAGFGYGGLVVTDPAAFVGYASAGRFSWGGAASTHFWVDPREGIATVVLQQRMPYDETLATDIGVAVYQALE